MVDRNGRHIKIGDKIRPILKGRTLQIVSQMYVPEMGECLFGQQIEDPLAFSPLTQENLKEYWILIEE